ncbi:MAG TPA: hypothetical protein VFB66_03850 [Tepidisphaeraceae bacterium]|nr:hypothetical protein [Tepidisphaeraceae bacterium]
MGQYHFGTGQGRVSKAEAKRVDRIARKHGADFTSVRLPEGYRYWFSCANRGAPFDGDTARAVLTEVGRVRLLGEAR